MVEAAAVSEGGWGGGGVEGAGLRQGFDGGGGDVAAPGGGADLVVDDAQFFPLAGEAEDGAGAVVPREPSLQPARITRWGTPEARVAAPPPTLEPR